MLNLKVLIADDEPDVCELIHKLICWKELGLSSIGSVQSGQDAMEIVLRQKVDIVITDIQMPGMTGLEMIEKAYQQGLQTKFIVVSGYQEFQYAQSALRFGVEDYLLKPISKTDINLVLRRLIEEHSTAQHQRDHQEMIQSELLQKNTILRKNELSQMILDYKRSFGTEMFSFQPGVFLFIEAHVSLRDKKWLDEIIVSNVLENIMLRLRDRLKDHCFDFEYVLDDCNAYSLVNYSETVHLTYQDYREIVQKLLREVSTQYQNVRIFFSLGEPVRTSREIGRALETAEQANCLRLYAGGDRVLEQTKLAAELTDRKACSFGIENEKKLLQMIETFQAEEAQALVKAVYGNFSRMAGYELNNLFRVTLRLIQHIRLELVALGLREENCPPVENGPAVPTESMIHRALANSDSIPELTEFLCFYIRAEIEYCVLCQQRKLSEPIQIAQEYVRANIHRQISLEEVAVQVFVSPGYFSTLFKERVGKTFSDYMIEMRVEEAKRLLRQTECATNEVAERVGYADARHFSKVFSKLVGVTPAVYRKIYL